MTKVNVNAASREELIDIAGLSAETAERLIRLRDEHGRIDGPEALSMLLRTDRAMLVRLRDELDFTDEDDGALGADVQSRRHMLAEQTLALARACFDTLNKQIWDNMQTALALARAREWHEVVSIQQAHVASALGRMDRLAVRWLVTTQEMMAPDRLPATAERLDRAA